MYKAKTKTGANAIINFWAVMSDVLLTTTICIANNIADRITGKYRSLAKPHPVRHPTINRKEKIKKLVAA